MQFCLGFRTTVHATIAERSYAERAAFIELSAVINLACNSPPTRNHPARTGAAKNHSAIMAWPRMLF